MGGAAMARPRSARISAIDVISDAFGFGETENIPAGRTVNRDHQSEFDGPSGSYAGAPSGRTGFEGSPEMGGRGQDSPSGGYGGGGSMGQDGGRADRDHQGSWAQGGIVSEGIIPGLSNQGFQAKIHEGEYVIPKGVLDILDPKVMSALESIRKQVYPGQNPPNPNRQGGQGAGIQLL